MNWNNLLIAGIILAAHMLGHASGYRLAKYRIRNKIKAHMAAVKLNSVVGVTDFYTTILQVINSI